MADQTSGGGGERTELPTQRRLDKAHQEGQIPRSQELSGAVILLAGTAALAMAGGSALATHLTQLVDTAARWLTIDLLDVSGVTLLLRTVLRDTLYALVPFGLGVVALALLVNTVQARGVFSWSPVEPKLSHVNPVNGLKKIFSWQAPFTLFKSVLKLGFLTAVTVLIVYGAGTEVVSLADLGIGGIATVLRKLTLKTAFITGLSFLAIASLDYAFQVYQHQRRLRMTKHEIQREHKETEGDPLIKSRMRSLARTLSRNRMIADVAEADLVLTNPTHIAVALRYDPLDHPAPIVLAMGQRKLAERIKAAAYAAAVPVVENKPLAQTLHATATIGQPIPPELYVAVAEVIAFVYRAQRRSTAALGWTAGHAV